MMDDYESIHVACGTKIQAKPTVIAAATCGATAGAAIAAVIIHLAPPSVVTNAAVTAVTAGLSRTAAMDAWTADAGIIALTQ